VFVLFDGIGNFSICYIISAKRYAILFPKLDRNYSSAADLNTYRFWETKTYKWSPQRSSK
jgi:hypothetical protein